jgi:type IV secretory pathway component VirB8
MNLWLVIAMIAVLCIFGLIATIMVIKQEESRMKQYEEDGDTAENELKRSLEYETKSISSNVKSLSWIYIVAIALSFIAFALYMYIR